jgi:hypothetical protein
VKLKINRAAEMLSDFFFTLREGGIRERIPMLLYNDAESLEPGFRK